MKYKIILDRNEIIVNDTVSRNELLRLAGITEKMELEAINSHKSAGTGWEAYWQPLTGKDELIEKEEVIDLKSWLIQLEKDGTYKIKR